MSKNEIEVTLANGYTVQLFEHEGNMILGLVNQNGYYISDTKLTKTEIATLERMFSKSNVEFVGKLPKRPRAE